MKFQILLYYKYVNIPNPELEKQRQLQLMERFNLKCRIIVAAEGINGTLEGTVEDTEAYISYMESTPEFNNIQWKRAVGNGNAFPKVNVKVRNEIVSLNLGANDINPNQVTGKYITAAELHELYKSQEEFYVVDMRNDYEQKIGHFENAILMPIKNFREIPDQMESIQHLKHKKVITTCTGGVRCEKASGFLVSQGFTNVYQLHGGMQTYMEQYPNAHFLGKLYVFDGRIVWGVNESDPSHKIVGKCDLCSKPADTYYDCGYLHCKNHRHLVACNDCYAKSNGVVYCSSECKDLAAATGKLHKNATRQAYNA